MHSVVKLVKENKGAKNAKRLYLKRVNVPHELHSLKRHGIVYKWNKSIFHNEENDLLITCQEEKNSSEKRRKRKKTTKKIQKEKKSDETKKSRKDKGQ